MPEKKITLVPKKEKFRKGPSKILIQIGIAILIIVILGLLGIKIYQRILISNFSSLTSTLKSLIEQRDKKLEKEILIAGQKLSNIDILLMRHVYSSKLFNFLEENTHPQVSLSGFSSNMKTISLSGRTVSFEILSKQITIFSLHSQVSKVILNNVSFSPQGGVDFSLTINIKPPLIKD